MNNHDEPLSSAGASVSLASQVLAASRRPAVWAPVLMAFLLLLVTLNSDLMRDDYYHRALLLGDPTLPGMESTEYDLPLAMSQLFSFFTEENQFLERLKAYGNVPWWTDDELQVNFWRPLAAATHWLDYQLWPDSIALMRLHSLLWYVLVGVLLGTWLIQLGVNRLALWWVMLLYVLDASHVHAIAWLANRNILIATAFGLLSMMALTQFSAKGKPGYLILSWLAFLAALLSAEAGISFLGIVIAFLLVLEPRSIPKRLGLLFSFLALIVVWRILYRLQGYGSLHSGFYVDPIGDTANFLQSLLLNGPIMLYEQLVRVPSLSMLMAPQVEVQQAVISVIVLLIAVAIFSPLLLKSRLAMFGFFCAVIALPPACATIISGGRLMFIFGIGMSLVLGLWFAGMKQKAPWFDGPSWYRGLAWVWSGVLLAAILLGTTAVWATKIVSSLSADDAPFKVHTDVIDNVREDQTLVLMNPPVLFDQVYMPWKAHYFGLNAPRNMISLVPGYAGFTASMLDERTLMVEKQEGFQIINTTIGFQPEAPQSHLVYLAARADRFFTSNHREADFSRPIAVDAATVRVLSATPQGDPTRIQFEFAQPLFSDKTVVLLWDWDEKRYVKLNQLPAGSFVGPF